MITKILYYFSQKTVKKTVFTALICFFCLFLISPGPVKATATGPKNLLKRFLNFNWNKLNENSQSPFLIYLLHVKEINKKTTELIEGKISASSTTNSSGDFNFFTEKERLRLSQYIPGSISFYLPQPITEKKTVMIYDSWLATSGTKPVSVTLEQEVLSTRTVGKERSLLEFFLQPVRIYREGKEVLTELQMEYQGTTGTARINQIAWVDNHAFRPLIIMSQTMGGKQESKRYFALYLTVNLFHPEEIMEKFTLFQGGNITGLNQLFNKMEINENYTQQEQDLYLHLSRDYIALSYNYLINGGKIYSQLGIKDRNGQYLFGLEKNLLNNRELSLVIETGNELQKDLNPALRLGISDEVTYLDRIKIKAMYFPFNYQLSRADLSSNHALGKLIINYPFADWGLTYIGTFCNNFSGHRLSLKLNLNLQNNY